MIETVSISDHNYIMPTVVMFCSVCENNKDIPITFHLIVDDSVNDKDKERLSCTLQNYSQKYIVFHEVNLDHLSKIPKSKMFPISTYYRMELAEILPSDLKKVLFLDGDMIIRNSIIDLWNTNVSGYAYAAVHDNTEGNMSYYNRLQYSSKYGYFNSGVMLINLIYWRDNDITAKMMNYINIHPERILYCDQDVFNCIMHGNILPLHFKYNLQNGFLYNPQDMNFDYYEYKSELQEAIQNPVIIHFTSSTQKPWMENCKHPFTKEFLYYRDKTEYSNAPLTRRKKSVKLIVMKLFQELGYLKKDPSYLVF